MNLQYRVSRVAGWRSGLSLLVSVWVLGCATTADRGAQGPIFYPAAPSEPRLQFLVSYSNEKDVGGGPSKLLTFVVGKTESEKIINKPVGLALRHGKLYVSDVAYASIDILDLEKHELHYFTPSGEGSLGSPVAVAVDEDDTRYVADTARGQVLIYGADGSYRAAIGERVQRGPARAHGPAPVLPTEPPPTGDVPAMRPTDVLIAGDHLYVADMDNHCVRIYDKNTRKQLFTIPAAPAVATEESRLVGPLALAMDTEGRLYVSDVAAFRVQQYDAQGQHLRSFGTVGDRPGQFARPKGVAVDRAGRVWVVDAAAQVVQVFDQEGRLLMYFGEPRGSAAPMDLPFEVLIDYDHVPLFQKHAAPGFELEYLVIVSNQYGARKISVYGFGHKK